MGSQKKVLSKMAIDARKEPTSTIETDNRRGMEEERHSKGSEHISIARSIRPSEVSEDAIMQFGLLRKKCRGQRNPPRFTTTVQASG